MRVIQQGDKVGVHYVKRFQGGSVVTSRGKAPTGLTIGVGHPRLPGLGLALVGLAVGESRTLLGSAPGGYGPYDPGRVRRLARTRFAGQPGLAAGRWVRLWDRHGRRRLVRIVEVRENTVVVDTNRPWAGQSVELEVEVLAIDGPEAASGAGPGPERYPPDRERDCREGSWLDDGGRQ
jgi:peptidylprolyl isomerase